MVSLYIAPLMEPVQRWFVFMNTGVHSLMYPYFAFKVNTFTKPDIKGFEMD